MSSRPWRKWVVDCRKSPYDVYIGRPRPYGNPFSWRENSLVKFKVLTANEAVNSFEKWLMTQPDLISRIKKDLKGKILGCFGCRRCHGEILARIANEDL